jgi:hypothetical protein
MSEATAHVITVFTQFSDTYATFVIIATGSG